MEGALHPFFGRNANTNLPSISMGGGTTQALGGSLRGRATSRHNMHQDFKEKEAASKQHQLLSTCVKLKSLCQNVNFETTKYTKYYNGTVELKQINMCSPRSKSLSLNIE